MTTELEKALDQHDTWIHTLKMVPPPSDVIVDAARRVANLDYEAAIVKHNELYPVPLSAKGEEWVRQIVDAALGTTTEDGECPECGGTGAGQVQTPWKTNPCESCDGTGDRVEKGTTNDL